METFCANTGRSKYRPALTNGSFYPPTYNTTFRQSKGRQPTDIESFLSIPHSVQNEYNLGLSSRHSALLWREQPQPNSAKSKGGGRTCSIALAAASLIVLVAVVSIAGLALYMGTLRGETTNPLLVFSCSVRILRGDRFIGNLQEKARRYKNQLEILYQRSPLSSAIIGCNVEKFGNDTQTIYYKITLNKRKIPRSITNIEKVIRDTLLSDALSKKPIFKNIRFDSRSVSVRLNKEQNLYQRVSKPKPEANTKFGEVLKPTTKLRVERPKENATMPMKSMARKPEIQEVNVEEDNLPVIQGSFQISKTEADIAVNKKSEQHQSTKKVNLKETAVTSSYYKVASIDPMSKPSVASSKDMSKSTTPTTTKASVDSTTKSEEKQFGTVELERVQPSKMQPGKIQSEKSPFVPSELVNNEPWIPIISKEKSPTYTSFTNPALTFRFTENDSVHSHSLMKHPLPVNKLSEITETSIVTSSTTERSDFVNNVTDFFEILASNESDEASNDAAVSEGTTSPIVTTSSSTTENFGQGQVEVVEPDDLLPSLMTQQQTTKLPLVTLMPVKSNSGIGRPLRKRPSFDVENRSFFKKPSKGNVEEINIEDQSTTSKNLNDFRIMGMLNFHQDAPIEASAKGIIRNQKMALSEIGDIEIEKIIAGEASNIPANVENTQYLTPNELKELSEISHLSQNDTQADIISNSKAVRASYTINHDGFKVLTKTYNKINLDKEIADLEKTQFPAPVNVTECTQNTIKCGNGHCIPNTARCNQLIDCENGSDEQNCTCADYLRSQLLKRKICDGIVDCWDFSDENECEWCTPESYVCANSKICINKTKICDGTNDCPLGDDERRCIIIAENTEKADEFSYNAEGYLLVRKFGKWGKLCLESPENVAWNFKELARSVCNAISYQTLEDTYAVRENTTDANDVGRFVKIVESFQNGMSNSSVIFKETDCTDREVLKIKCGRLECGTRPQVTHVARIVGGINAGLGAWPWQAALYKEGEFQCGATLLSEKWLISAGHCFYHTMDEHWVARLGTLRRGTTLTSPYEQLRHIVRIVLHPDYVDAGFINDVSLLQMEFAVTFSDYVRPICLPKESVTVLDGTMCTVIGWGQLFETGRIFPDTLQEVQIPVISTEECRKRTVFLPLYRITDNMFCAGFDRGGRDACLGDSGGGLMCPEDDGRWTLQGVTSNGYGCARKDRPGVYTKVSNYISWIFSYINDQNDTVPSSKSLCNGHRCPLGDCLPANRLCNGYIECSDSSDEMHCFK